ncbi:hypothetical protein AVV36_gp089 [Pectobacterium bacteriophage PM2]|uniref:DUF3592 domain-containing protein n=1 Tax=Pectobacterium bacteriophage PM2 TaxID=1429794 RepID=A0A0A0Q0D5_9CAUD|nr:hypothetical protein AVV36_gp089 [Pectobacterium bacteriophage PM2]AHY25051.1 hypothetical protein PM2_089 [Pectobacterium bacteriophage PM2]
MYNSFNFKCFILAVIFGVFSYFTDILPDSTREQPYTAEIVKMYDGTSGGKYSHLEFIVVYRLDDGYLFDQRVSASFFSMAQVGQKYTVNKRPYDIIHSERTGMNAVWFFVSQFIYLISYTLAIILFAISVVPYKFWEDD